MIVDEAKKNKSLATNKMEVETTMKLADKPFYPDGSSITKGATFREQLVIALASNSRLIKLDSRIIDIAYKATTVDTIYPEDSAKAIIQFADAIIAEMNKAKS